MISKALREQATDHVEHLARKHRITLHWSRSHKEAHSRTRQAWVPHIYSVLDYLISLHEVGHIVSKVSGRAYDRYVKAEREKAIEHELVSESAAWGWAIDHANPALLKRLTRTEALSMAKLLLTYLLSDDQETLHRLVPIDPDGYPVP